MTITAKEVRALKITGKVVSAFLKGDKGFNHSANDAYNEANGMLNQNDQRIMRILRDDAVGCHGCGGTFTLKLAKSAQASYVDTYHPKVT